MNTVEMELLVPHEFNGKELPIGAVIQVPVHKVNRLIEMGVAKKSFTPVQKPSKSVSKDSPAVLGVSVTESVRVKESHGN